MKMFRAFTNDDVELQLLRYGSHGLTEPQSLLLIQETAMRLRKHIQLQLKTDCN